jgi:hypothetical protein
MTGICDGYMLGPESKILFLGVRGVTTSKSGQAHSRFGKCHLDVCFFSFTSLMTSLGPSIFFSLLNGNGIVRTQAPVWAD